MAQQHHCRRGPTCLRLKKYTGLHSYNQTYTTVAVAAAAESINTKQKDGDTTHTRA
jgi:hypothetical protein